ncbi:MAG: Zn-ribbon domain-containing OB-fold protein [bacterium]
MPGEVVKATVPITFVYKNRVGKALEQFIGGLKERKILGVKCPTCKKVYVPPRTVCSTCHKPIDKMVEISQEGTLKNFTISYVNIVNGEIKDAQEPYVIGLIKLKGASSLISAIVKAPSVDAIKTGMRVKAVWKESTQGDYSDLLYFEAVQ